MTSFRLIAAAAASAALLSFAAVPAATADTQLAQGKSSGKVMSGEKGSDKARDAMKANEDRMTGKDNAMERGEGKKKGLHKQMEGGKDKMGKK